MREILFRGNLTDSDEWVYGFYCYNPFMKRAEIFSFDNVRSYVYEVIPETVGQYTGLTDKNGVRIFEGDICSTDLSRPYTIVEFRNGCFMYQIENDGNVYYDIMMPIEPLVGADKFTEVIGNIHDNSELLGVGEWSMKI